MSTRFTYPHIFATQDLEQHARDLIREAKKDNVFNNTSFPVLLAYLRALDYDGLLESKEEVEEVLNESVDKFRGKFGSFEEFGSEVPDSLFDLPEGARPYFDAESFATDIINDGSYLYDGETGFAFYGE